MKNKLKKESLNNYYSLNFSKAALLVVVISIFFTQLAFANDQNKNVKISLKEGSFIELIEQVSSQTDYTFLFQKEDIESISNINIDKTISVKDLLNNILPTKGLSYSFDNNSIVVTKNPVKKEPITQAPKTSLALKIVESETKTPIAGATVIIVGTSEGAISDSSGDILINKIKVGDVLEISYVGYEVLKYTVTTLNGANIVVELKKDVLTVDDVVVVAYGTAKKSSITGSVATISSEHIQSAKVSSVSQALQGTVPGIQSVASSGQPGTDATIRIRGIGSVLADSNPLYVLDGVPYSGSINSINPNDIQSISVLKDAASSALYGSRGANGVIIITTKQGRSGSAPTVNVTANFGISNRSTRDYDQLSTEDYFKLTWEAIRNGHMDEGRDININIKEASKLASTGLVPHLGINPYGNQFKEPIDNNGNLVDGAKQLYFGDWAGELIRPATRTEVGLNISGGSDKATYYASAGYLSDNGIAITSKFDRFTTKLNSTFTPKKWITINLGLSGTYSNQNAPKSDDSAINNVIGFARNLPSFYPIYEFDQNKGEYSRDENGDLIYDFGNYRAGSYKGYNLLATLPQDKQSAIKYVVSSRIGATLNIYKGLTFRTSFAFDLNDEKSENFTNSLLGRSVSSGGGSVNELETITSWTFNNILNYNFKIKESHQFDFMLGQEAYQYNRVESFGSVTGFPIADITAPSAGVIIDSYGGFTDMYTLMGYFGQAKYSYEEKYNLSASMRIDGSSRFHPDNRWGTFWSVGASWDISKEDFLKSNTKVNYLILKASYGAQGNDNIGTYYAYQQLYALSKNNGNGSAAPTELANPNLKWESNLNFNVGVDFSILSNRLRGGVEYFTRKSQDLLFEMPVAPSLGYTTYNENIGTMSNNGFEVNVTGVVIENKNLSWSLNLNATHYKNKMVSLPREEIIDGTKRMSVGSSLYDFWVREYAGTSKTKEVVMTGIKDGSPVMAEVNGGRPLWYYVNDSGEKIKTSDYNNATLDYHGSALPTFYGGFGTELKYKNFEMRALFAYSIGGYILDRDVSSLLGTGSGPGTGWSVQALDRWTPENQDTDYPRLTTGAYTNGWRSNSTAGLVDASYLRLKNLTLTYNLSDRLLNTLKLSKASVYLQGENLFTLFGTQGLDPEIAGINGVSFFRYPTMRTFSVGVNIMF